MCLFDVVCVCARARTSVHVHTRGVSVHSGKHRVPSCWKKDLFDFLPPCTPGQLTGEFPRIILSLHPMWLKEY